MLLHLSVNSCALQASTSYLKKMDVENPDTHPHEWFTQEGHGKR